MNKILTFDELNNLAEKLADYSCENTVIALIGDLGTEKLHSLNILLKD